MAHDEQTKVLITFTKRQQGKTPGETHGMQYRYAKAYVGAGVAVWSKPDDSAIKGFSGTDKPYCCTQRVKTVFAKDGSVETEGYYKDGGPLKLSSGVSKALATPTKDKAVRSAPFTK